MKKPLNAKRILIADDNRDCRDILRMVLQNRGYQVTLAKDGTEAIREIEGHPPDLILLDVMMPGKNGFDVCAWVKKDPKISHTFIIMISAAGDPASRERGLKAGADDYLIKPLDPLDVILRIQRFLKKHPR